MAANISRLQSDMQQARSVVTGAAGDMQKAANTARDALGALGVGLSVGGAIASIQQVGKALIEAEASAVKFKAAFTAISGADSVGREMEFVRSTARQLGLDLESVSGSYLKLSASARGTSLEGQATRDIFTAVSKAATTLGLSSSEADGALLAVSQMMSKGTVQAEELRGQL
ncbi:MAG: tape measure protein, partial [Steroidobacteraceae bacterium]|nr:tape measure protein [Steroidobacteraceae bacterium]